MKIKRLYTWKKDKIDHRDYVINLKTDPQSLASVSKVDLRSKCPSIYNQGNLGSCVSNGIAFCIQFDQIKYNFTHLFTPSRLFIYYNTRVIENSVNEDSGTTIRDALVSVNKQGACPETTWPYNISQFAVKPSSPSYQSGLQHLVKTYTRVIFDINQMKQCLVDGFPFVFGILLYSSFNKVGSNGLVPIPNRNEQLLGGHCMACIGFDDSKSCFIIRNSWGDTWGDHGHCYIPYSYLCNPNYTFDTWTIRTISDTEMNISTINSVIYGKKNKYIDVTTIFQNYFNQGHTSILVDNNMFTDPCYGLVKELKISFKNGSVLTFPEHAIISLTSITLTPTNIIRTSNITKAMYGKGTRMIDVTATLKNQFSQGYPQVPISNKLFTDPCFGIVKELQVTLSNKSVRVFPEGGVITINDIIV